MAEPGMTAALILLIDGKLRITYHESEDAAGEAANALPNYQHGAIIECADHLHEYFYKEFELGITGYQMLYDQLAGADKPKGEKPLRYLDDAKQKCWALLLSHLDGHPDFGVSEQVVVGSNAGDEPAADPPVVEEVSEEATAEAPPAPEPIVRKAPAVKASAVKKAPAKAVPVKPAAKAEAAPVKPAAKATAKPAGTGRGKGLSAEWRATLGALGKLKEGATTAELKALCEKHGVKPWWGRFVESGAIERTDRGQYKLTDTGRKMITV
jgi:hypothetical protein